MQPTADRGDSGNRNACTQQCCVGILPGVGLSGSEEFYRSVARFGGTHANIIYCAGNDSVFAFLQDVIDEVVELFPSRYIHLGGERL